MNPQEVFCPNNDCRSRGVVGQGNIRVHSYPQRRYRCTACKKTFVATKGTVLYRLRSDEEIVARVVTLLAFGCPPAAIVAAFGLDARTVASWQRRAGAHCEQVHQERVLSVPQDLRYVQADEVRVKLQRRLVLWMALAICVPTRLWLGGVVNRRRDRWLIGALAAKVKACARLAPLLLVSDGFSAYVSAWKKAFRTPLHTGRRGRPALLCWPEVVIGQVVKVKEKGHVIGVVQAVVVGNLERVLALLPGQQGLNTVYIERLNGTFRARLAGLVRRGRSLLRQEESLHVGMYLVGTVYNFCTPHQSLKRQTPAQAAGLTDHCWSVAELLGYRVAPPPWSPPKRRRRSRQAKQESTTCTV